MTATTLNAKSLGTVQNISKSKITNIMVLPMPTEDSDATEFFDMLGVVESITVTGFFSSDTISATKDLMDDIDELADGTQDDTISFVSDQTGTVAVKVQSVRSSWDSTTRTKCNYTVTLVKGV